MAAPADDDIGANKTLPVTISSVNVLGAKNTRRGFLDRIFSPLLTVNDNSFYTLKEALEAVSEKATKLERFDIFEPPISVFFDKPDQTDPSSTPTDLDVFVSVREKPRFVASSGTWAGTNDGSLYLTALLRNAFGGAETVSANATYGMRTRSAYSLGFDTPILSNPNLRWELGAAQSTTDKAWASHAERLQGALTKFKYLTESGHRHEFGYSGTWRQISGLAERASPTVRADAGDSFKSSLQHVWTLDRRDHPLLPTRGYLMKTVTELAGGLLNGDIAFAKVEAEASSALPIPVPGISTWANTGITLATSLRGGLLYPLGDQPKHSRINDRFFLGGPNDVRGFRHCGLGPHDGSDAVGGDLYAAGGASLLFPLPRVSNAHPVRLQAFVTGGRLLALKDARPADAKGQQMSTGDVASSVRSTFAELADGLPTVAAGFGLVYAPSVARFEVNFSLPLVMRRGEEARKGLSVGVGLTFL